MHTQDMLTVQVMWFKVQAQVNSPFLNRNINVVLDAIIYHKRDVNKYTVNCNQKLRSILDASESNKHTG